MRDSRKSSYRPQRGKRKIFIANVNSTSSPPSLVRTKRDLTGADDAETEMWRVQRKGLCDISVDKRLPIWEIENLRERYCGNKSARRRRHRKKGVSKLSKTTITFPGIVNTSIILELTDNWPSGCLSFQDVSNVPRRESIANRNLYFYKEILLD